MSTTPSHNINAIIHISITVSFVQSTKLLIIKKHHLISMVELKSESVPDLDNLINLSDHMLTIPQREFLNKGLKFCPTPGEAQMGDLRRDLDKYHRSLRLKSHFKDDTAKATDGTSIGPFNDTSCLKLQSLSKYNPPVGSNNLETVITMNEIGL